MGKILPLPKKTQSTDGSIFLPDKTGFYFISAVGESLLKVNADGKCIQTALNHTQKTGWNDCPFLTKPCFLEGGPHRALEGPCRVVVSLCGPQGLSSVCPDKLLVHTLSSLLMS